MAMHKATEQERQILVKAASRFRIGGQLLPEQLEEGLSLITATLMLLKNHDHNGDEVCYCAGKVLTLAQDMVWQCSHFMSELYDSEHDFEVTSGSLFCE